MYYDKATDGERTYFRGSNRLYRSVVIDAYGIGFRGAVAGPGSLPVVETTKGEYDALNALKSRRFTADTVPSSQDSWVWNSDLATLSAAKTLAEMEAAHDTENCPGGPDCPYSCPTREAEKSAEIEPVVAAEFATREEWLMALIERLRPLYLSVGSALPEKLRASCSFPSRGGMKGGGSQTIGQCWYPAQSASGHTEIFITPTLARPLAVAEILVHELVHAALGPGHGHGAAFKRLAKAVGLEGKMTATNADPVLRRHLVAITGPLGPYPHAELDASQIKKQTTRLIKVACPHCDYTVRVTRKWLDEAGGPLCPVHHEPMEE